MSSPASLERPYVGVRPYTRAERQIFFGRARDGRYIANKIFASRMTLFYAPSGAGKSSILCALVLPDMETQQARTVYFDAWRGGDPLEALKEELVRVATEAGVVDAGAGGPTLSELVALLGAVDGRTVVLVLDQFEELLLPAQLDGLESFRAELRQLVSSSGPDVRVVLSLREEHLAALEAFRDDIVDLFQSTCRLEALGRQGLEAAIREPAALFGVEWEPALVEALIDDLTAGGARTVELPMLQIVCDRLWAANRNRETLTLGLYQFLGGAEAILDEYVRSVMPSTVAGQLFTARLMQALAPHSGFKVAFTAKDLAATCNLPLARVGQELKRLAQENILRTRQFKTKLLYELQHDALIAIVGFWRDEVLGRHRERRAARKVRRLRALAVAIALLALSTRPAYLWFRRHQAVTELEEVHAYIERPAAPGRASVDIQAQYAQDPALRARAERAFDEVARFELFESRPFLFNVDLSGSEGLRRLLIADQHLLPPGYGLVSGGDAEPEAPEDGWWPITLQHSCERVLDQRSLQFAWRLAIHSFAERGIPVPDRIKFLPGDLHRSVGRISGRGIDKSIVLPESEDGVLIPTAKLPAEAQRFLDELPEKPCYGRAVGGPWCMVPRWSLPVWRAAGVQAIKGSALPAILVAEEVAREVDQEPEKLLDPAAVKVLLDRVAAQGHRQTVEQAILSRGPVLTADMVALQRKDKSLRRLVALLDTAAAYRPAEQDSEHLAGLVVDGWAGLAATGRGPHGPWSREGPGPWGGPLARAEVDGVERSTQWLPSFRSEARCYFGADLRDALMKDRAPRPELQERVLRAREYLFQQFGFSVPDLQFVPDSNLPQQGFRLELFDQGLVGEEAEQRTLADWEARNPAIVQDVVTAAYRHRAEELRHRWIDAELVSTILHRLEVERPALYTWLTKSYSVTDLKELLRAVVRPESDEAASRRAQVGSTVAYPEWLLGSLVVWARTDDGSLKALASRMRDTARARVKAQWPRRPPEDAAGKEIAGIANELSKGNVDWVNRELDRELPDRRAVEAAANAFAEAYAGAGVQRTEDDLRGACAQPMDGLPSVDDRWELADYLHRDAPGLRDAAEVQRLWLCLFASTPSTLTGVRRELAAGLVAHEPDPLRWAPDVAASFGLEVLELVDPVPEREGLAAAGRALLLSSLQRLPTIDRAEELFHRVLEQCRAPGPHFVCPELAQDMFSQRPKRWISVEWLTDLSEREAEGPLKKALELADHLDLSRWGPAMALRAQERVSLARATAHLHLADLGVEEGHREQGEAILRGLPSSPRAQRLLAESLAVSGSKEASRTVTQALRAHPDDPDLLLAQVNVAIRAGHLDEVARGADTRTLSYGSAPSGAVLERLYRVSLAQTLLREGDWQLTAAYLVGSTHPSRRLVSLMLYARRPEEDGSAQRALDEAWAQIDQSTWHNRLKGGDASVLEEKLVGYYLGKVARSEIFDPLSDDRQFAASPLRNLQRPRQWMQCEAQLYDGLLAQAQRQSDRKRQALDAARVACRNRIELGFVDFLSRPDQAQARTGREK